MTEKHLEEHLTELRRRVEALEARLEYSGEPLSLRETGPGYHVNPIQQGQVGVFVPANVFEDAGMTPEDLLVELALYLFDKEVLTLGQAKTLARMPMADFMTLLGQRGIEMHYGVNEFLEDVETLKEAGLWK